ncbi:hypothetical protein LA080_006053 [Diaporthe eres]|nr:hypothetical protein LA080_006053 [Diaporthe eres]
MGRRPRPQETRDTTDGQLGGAGAGRLSQKRGHESCLLRGPSSPGPERSRSPRIGLPWPAEEGHLSPPLLSWQSVSLPTGLGLPRGRARMLPGDPVREAALVFFPLRVYSRRMPDVDMTASILGGIAHYETGRNDDQCPQAADGQERTGTESKSRYFAPCRGSWNLPWMEIVERPAPLRTPTAPPSPKALEFHEGLVYALTHGTPREGRSGGVNNEAIRCPPAVTMKLPTGLGVSRSTAQLRAVRPVLKHASIHTRLLGEVRLEPGAAAAVAAAADGRKNANGRFQLCNPPDDLHASALIRKLTGGFPPSSCHAGPRIVCGVARLLEGFHDLSS